ncbi:uncharacterized protein RSE6_05161 [Rhynchosporium secalis]|uniref:Uncharacterized protein n=1 Tax=Rhynchosporium secalis TaxID=38038 RepID=A0A1E1M730_RHYSE|nr:uncharacterized protein RSE6_05161 [Rhynchosporium secalis]
MSLNEKRTQILQLCMGAMLWLPYMEPSSASIFCVRPGHCGAGLIRPEAFAHPVVVLGIRQRPGSTIWGEVLVRVCDVTTFQSTPLFGDRSHQANQHLIKFNESIPIQQHDSPWGYDPNWLQLGMGNIIGQSYVRAQHVWEISIDVLWNYYWSNLTAWSVRLNEDSYYRLMAHLGLEPQPCESMTELPVLGPRRLNDFSLLYAPNPVYNQPGLGNQPWFGNNPQGAYNGGSQKVDGFNRGGLNAGGTNRGGLDNRGNGGQTQKGGGQPGGINTAWTSNFWRSDRGTYNTISNIPTQCTTRYTTHSRQPRAAP